MSGASRAQLIGLARGQAADAGTPNPWEGYSAQALLADLGIGRTGADAQSEEGMAIADTLAGAYETGFLAAHPINGHRDYERRYADGLAMAAAMNGTS